MAEIGVLAWRRQAHDEQIAKNRKAGAALMRHLLSMYSESKISAKDLCIACHFAHESGSIGADFSRYGLAPGQSSDGAYQKKLDRSLPSAGPMYHVTIPVHDRNGTVRDQRETPTLPLHEALFREVQATPGLLEESRAAAWPPSYNEHHLVQEARAAGEDLPVPVALYLDGVHYAANQPGRNDGVLGIWCYFLQTHRRHLSINLRLRDLCKCGCRGWCTLHPHHGKSGLVDEGSRSGHSAHPSA
jgi:hypothetical protein